MFSDSDLAFMRRALALAERGLYTTAPNPRVGCVLVRDGRIIGEGFTQPAGFDHAEIQALKDARARGHDPAGATAYVTLEPCNHFGRTPPCSQALVAAGLRCVIAALQDPNPRVAGTGLATLAAAGIEVRCGLLEQEARELNIGFISRMARQRPWARLKVAASLDGRTALPDGQSQWITGATARADGHRWRARANAILTGYGTVRDDDPRLTVRGIDVPRQPLAVLVDSRLRVSPAARLLEREEVLVACASDSGEAAQRAAALRARGAQVVALPDHEGKVDLMALMRLLGEHQINEVHVEAGFRLNGSLIKAGCIDELLIYLAPTLLGDGLDMFQLGTLPSLAARRDLRFVSCEALGDDLRVIARWRDGKGALTGEVR